MPYSPKSLGDDILSSLMKNSPPAASNKATTFAPSSLQEDEDPFDRRTSSTKPTYNVGSRRLEDNKSTKFHISLFNPF